jgi:hypothetical protein
MSRRKRAAAAQLEQMAASRESAEVEFEVVDEAGAIIAETPNDEIIIEHAEDVHRPAEERADEPDALTKLKAQYAERETEIQRLKRERAEAEQRANENANHAAQGERNYREATIAAVDNAIALAKSNINAAQNALTVAAQRGDWDTHAKALAALSENTSQIQTLERAKADVERAPEPTAQQYQRPAADNFEQQISGFPPKTQSWLRQHKDDIYLNPARAGLAESAAMLAERKGIQVESEEYFQFIDEQMGYKSVTIDPKPNGGSGVPPVQRQAQTPAAPPARTTFGAPAGKSRRVQLSQDQRRAAVQLYADLPEHEALAKYAKGVAEIDSGKSNLLWSRDKYKGGAGV